MEWRKVFGALCVAASVLFCTAETAYFGNNLFPSSSEELACDAMSLMLAVAGLVIMRTKRDQKDGQLR